MRKKDEVYERLEREVDEWCKKLQGMQIPKSSALGSRKAVKEQIVRKALDRFLRPLSAKEGLEMQTGQSISADVMNIIVKMDRDYTLEELKAMCRERDLGVSGDKKRLAWKLLRYDLEKAEIN